MSFAVAFFLFEAKSNIGCSLFLCEQRRSGDLGQARHVAAWPDVHRGDLSGLEGGRRWTRVTFSSGNGEVLFCFPFSIRTHMTFSFTAAPVVPEILASSGLLLSGGGHAVTLPAEEPAPSFDLRL